MTKIKLCGLSRGADIQAANVLLPDYVGFVFAKKSRRYVAPEQARALKSELDTRICAVGVFVDTEPDEIARLLDEGVIDAAQLHGEQTPADVRALRESTGRPVIQAFRVSSRADVLRAEESPADWILLDHGAGGTGASFDWELAADVRRPFFLAGGLTPQNAAEAISRCRPFAVDTSSALETDGKKDPAKMAAFVAAVRGAGR